jgi:uncharacterized membrane protein YkvI
MKENKKKNSMDWKLVFVMAGAMTATLIGSGFATGQEIMQYFVAHEWTGILGVIATFLAVGFAGASFFRAGFDGKKNLDNPNDVFKVFAGDKIGGVYKYITLITLFLTYAVMVAGAGATVQQQFDLPVYIGSGFMYLISAVTVMLGMEKITSILGNIGPVIAIFAIILGLFSIFMNNGDFGQASGLVQEAVASGTIQAASGNWLVSALNYVGLIIILNAGFIARIGIQANNPSETKSAALFSSGIYALGILILYLAFMGAFSLIAGTQVPTLTIANLLHPWLAYAFIVIILLAIYSTVVSILWSVATSMTTDGTTQHKIATAILGLIATGIGLFLPFDQLVNLVYVIAGYFGIVFLFMMIWRTITRYLVP